MRIEIGIEPMGAVRTTKKMAGRTAAGQKYAAYKELVAWNIRQQMKEPLQGAIGAPFMEFRMPIPKSLQGKVEPGQYHTKKPDIDNLIKGLFDAANGIAWADDNRVAELGQVRKIYSDQPGIVLELQQIGLLAYGQAEQPKRTATTRKKDERKERSQRRRAETRR